MFPASVICMPTVGGECTDIASSWIAKPFVLPKLIVDETLINACRKKEKLL